MDPVSGICTCVLCTADDRDIHTNATTNTTSREIRPPSQQTMDRIMARIRENQDTVQHDRQVAREWQSSYQRRTHHTIEREMQRAEARWLAEPMLPTGEPRSQFPTRRDPTLVESVRRFSQGSELAVVQDYEFAIPNSESVHRSAPQTPAERTPTRRTLVDSAINLALTDSVGEQWNILPEFTRTVISSTSLELQAPPPPSYSQSIEPGTPIRLSIRNYAYFHKAFPTIHVGPRTASCTDIILLAPHSTGSEVLQPCMDRAAQIFGWHLSEDDDHAIHRRLYSEVYLTVDGKKVLATQENWPAVRAVLLAAGSNSGRCKLHIVMSQNVVSGELGKGRKAACWLRKIGRHFRGDAVVL